MTAGSVTPSQSAAIEDYAKAIYSLTGWGRETASTNDLAERLGVTPSSVSAMLKRLDEEGLVERVRYRGVRLTAEGTRVALGVLRRHRLLELFLAEVLEVPWEDVHDEAEVLEHALSEKLAELIAAKLGDPEFDPHGDPIPSREGAIDEGETVSLAELSIGEHGTFVRISDSDPEMLRWLSEQGIAVGDDLELIDRQPFEGPCKVRIGDREHVLGLRVAESMRIDRSS
jgi:DtxR family Mn-dependent transcriptional regulator